MAAPNGTTAALGATVGSEARHAWLADTSEFTQHPAKFQRLVGKLHGLGPLALVYFLQEIDGGASVVDRLPVYAAIDPDILRALGGDKLPAPMICGVPS
jgi:hypothetical protein